MTKEEIQKYLDAFKTMRNLMTRPVESISNATIDSYEAFGHWYVRITINNLVVYNRSLICNGSTQAESESILLKELEYTLFNAGFAKLLDITESLAKTRGIYTGQSNNTNSDA